MQRRFITTTKMYPHHGFEVEELDNANSTYAFNRLEEEVDVVVLRVASGLLILRVIIQTW